MSCFDGVSRHSLGIDEVHQGLSVHDFGSEQKYVSKKILIDELISYLFNRDYDSFDEKVRLLNQFVFNSQPVEHGFSTLDQQLLMA